MMEWKFNSQPVDYKYAETYMEKRVEAIIKGQADELIWFLEHPALITGGTSAKPEDLLDQKTLPIYMTGRGGQYTYHGPGQQIVYLLINLEKRNMMDIKQYILMLENWLISSLKTLNIVGHIRKDRIGVWVETQKNTEDKIAAIGVRVKKWVTYHGIALNISPNLEHYKTIIPCGIRSLENKHYGVTSLEKLGCTISQKKIQEILINNFKQAFGE